MSINPGDIVKFIRQKDYRIEKVVGQGGTGIAVLLFDEILNMYFLCKSYCPQGNNDRSLCFQYFIDEIRIMYLLSHKNVVRIYNYFLYPAQLTGYILMEYIKGQSLDAYFNESINVDCNDIFIQLISAFDYLEKNRVLHRDIRPSNFLVDENGNVKVIDFGFGKQICKDDISSMSILLDWPVSKFPNELNNNKYNHRTEMFFIGKMYEGLLKKHTSLDFRYHDIISAMTELELELRPDSFSNILEMISISIIDV